MIEAIVTDIEGTTTSLDFVHEVLFPYSRQRLADYVATHRDEPAMRKVFAALHAECNSALSETAAIGQWLQWIDEDSKAPSLKALQGLIWHQGYQDGELNGHLYEDAVRHLKAWKESGIGLFVYSSGSVLAQKLLFAHTAYGDLTPLFTDFFDTGVGPKRAVSSYTGIVARIGRPAERILFLSDIDAELDAAAEAGMRTFKLVRGGEQPPVGKHPQGENFDAVRLC